MRRLAKVASIAIAAAALAGGVLFAPHSHAAPTVSSAWLHSLTKGTPSSTVAAEQAETIVGASHPSASSSTSRDTPSHRLLTSSKTVSHSTKMSSTSFVTHSAQSNPVTTSVATSATTKPSGAIELGKPAHHRSSQTEAVKPAQQKPVQASSSSKSTDAAASSKSTDAATAVTPPKAAVPDKYGTFTIVVSKFQHVLVDEKVPVVPGESLMQYMHQYFKITTAYGGGFMVSIDGIRSQWTGVPVGQRKPYDWFLYVNGTEAPVGALSIFPKAGDVDVWDYQKWNPATGQ
ncbi:DUF4430 domain-containing protein [Alicyclobacillus sp. SP_1]|uniref:DUF4430 domain-containing protein n=1 Tax=Alicyclobacillus sp. SP_1 TaxID=2942475 RepID=UPI0021589F7C|nr:DUF4430 domain-containing protein [Alicyclobacillus sp. SP_1]